MTKEAKRALLENRKKVLESNGKDNQGVISKLNRQLRNMEK